MINLTSIVHLLRRLNPNYILLGFVGLAVCFNSYLHTQSPAYRYYKQRASELDDRFSEFRNQVQVDLALQFSNLLYRAISPIVAPKPFESEVISVKSDDVRTDITITKDSFLSPFLEIEKDYSYTDVRWNGQSFHGAYIDGFFYRLGDSYLGRSILEFHPECIILDHGVIRRVVLQKPKEANNEQFTSV